MQNHSTIQNNMYKYINPENPALKELHEYGRELVIEITEMFPDEMKKLLQQISEGIKTKNYDYISMGVHTAKRNVSYYIDYKNPIFELWENFEIKSRQKADEQREKGSTVENIDFTPDFEKLKEISEVIILEVKQLGEEYKNGKYS